ncbi:MAG: hypothetical protein HQL20_02120 [Candidatus Omnitrophica bacterium]|nr:hypothetical protein [Candidatus Omnitrophota bacterium]
MERNAVLQEDILKCARPICAGLGLELVELTVRAFNDALSIELLADLPGGGISFEECARLNRALDKELYETLKLGDNYTLEVSSPGLDRPLTGIADFRRNTGRRIRLFLRERVAGKMEMDAVVKGVTDAEVLLETKFGDLSIGVDKIERARQIVI